MNAVNIIEDLRFYQSLDLLKREKLKNREKLGSLKTPAIFLGRNPRDGLKLVGTNAGIVKTFDYSIGSKPRGSHLAGFAPPLSTSTTFIDYHG